jgi:hypothetical protein
LQDFFEKLYFLFFVTTCEDCPQIDAKGTSDMDDADKANALPLLALTA